MFGGDLEGRVRVDDRLCRYLDGWVAMVEDRD